MYLQLESLPDSQSRLDCLLLERLRRECPTVSRARLKTAFQQKQILLFGKPANAALRLSPGVYSLEIVHWNPLQPATALPSPRGCFLPIVYEDASILVLNKVSGVPSLPHAAEETETAVGAALAHFPALARVGQKGLEPGLLHRLDTETSGLLVFAKDSATFEHLWQAWRHGQVRKVYRGLVRPRDSHQPLPRIPSTIDLPLAQSARSAPRMILAQGKKPLRGKPLSAHTRLISAREIAHWGTFPSRWDLEITMSTGVRHQIRCHLSAIGCPILGDRIYGGESAQRLWLHAWKLELSLLNGTVLLLESPLPEGWPG